MQTLLISIILYSHITNGDELKSFFRIRDLIIYNQAFFVTKVITENKENIIRTRKYILTPVKRFPKMKNHLFINLSEKRRIIKRQK